jgi:MYXO-CTERM domain-containing protein
VAPAVTVSSALTGLSFVSNSGDCTTAYPCKLGDLQAGDTRTFTSTLKAGTTSDGNGVAVATADSVSATGAANVSALTVKVPTTPSGGGGSTGGCTATLGPPAPWLALLGLVALARRRRRA